MPLGNFQQCLSQRPWLAALFDEIGKSFLGQLMERPTRLEL
jgi:hypothetical protein